MNILMPQLGETVTEGTVTVWHKKVGDKVEANELLFEVSTDKVDTEIPAPVGGVLTAIAVEEGTTVKVGTPLGVIEEAAGAKTAPSSAGGKAAPSNTGAKAAPGKDDSGGVSIDVLMPQLGETVTEGTITAWHKKIGDAVSPNDVLFEVSTDKVDTEIPAPVAGILAEISVPEGETVKVGVRLAVISGAAGKAAKPAAAAASAATPTASAPSAKGNGKTVFKSVSNRDPRGNPLSPVVRRLIAENGLDPAAISGTGAEGRIKRRDVEAFLRGKGGGAAPRRARPARGPRETKTIPLSNIRKRTGEHMVMSKATSPHVLQAVEVDFHLVEKARRARGDAWKAKNGFSLTYLPFIASAVCQAIGDFPNINASIVGDDLVVHGPVNLGIAVDLSFEGLLVPVLKDAHLKSVAEIALGIRDLSDRARTKKLSPDDLQGGTYTLSNSGPFGTLITAPVISQPQVAILSTDGVKKRPVVIEGPDGDSIAIRPVGVLAQSFDHRAFDGAYSGAFLNRVREIVETTDWTAELG